MLKKGDMIQTGDIDTSVRIQEFLRDKGIKWRDSPFGTIHNYGEFSIIMTDERTYVCVDRDKGMIGMTEKELYQLFEEVLEYEIY